MPGTVLNAFQLLAPSSLTITLWGRYSYYPHFTEKTAEMQRGTYPRSRSCYGEGAGFIFVSLWLHFWVSSLLFCFPLTSEVFCCNNVVHRHPQSIHFSCLFLFLPTLSFLTDHDSKCYCTHWAGQRTAETTELIKTWLWFFQTWHIW